MRTSLEQERRTLLEQFEASRQVYRQMLRGDAPSHRETSSHGRIVGRPGSSSGSQIGQWMSDHPLHIAAGVALLVWLTPGLIRRVRSQRAKHTISPALRPPTSPRTGAAKAIATVLVLLLRDRRRLQNTASVLNTAWRWLRRRTFPSTSTPTPTPGRKSHA